MASGHYDDDLRMFRDAPRDLNVGVLRFLRWLAERGRLEHETFGQPSGDQADSIALGAGPVRP